ncbi:uncharacterized protein [Chironomus tepperi]|uniref:uncharacterized protein n=1 Tax=Chironomus tepperi TaxID=113505 RepID=UPI00391EFB3C
MSFIISGEVVVTRLTFIKSDNETIDMPVNLLGCGESFGEIGLIYNEKRYASCTAETDCELLLLYKEDFDKILRPTLEAKHENITKALGRFEYFNNYTTEKIRECCVISKIAQYDPQDIIFSQNDISNFSYFVLSGQCMILQCLKLREKPNGKVTLVAPRKRMNALDMAIIKKFSSDKLKSITDGDDATIKYQFVDVGTFSVGAVFGISENIENRIIIARTVVQCLLIPRLWLFQKAQNIGNVWPRIKLFLNSSIPSQQKLFEEHLRNKKWKKYKTTTIEQIKQHNRISDPETRFYNIPTVCRIQEQ